METPEIILAPKNADFIVLIVSLNAVKIVNG